MKKTFFEKFLDAPLWQRGIVYFVFFNVVWMFLGWQDTGSIGLIDDMFVLAILIGLSVVLAVSQKSIYNSIFGHIK